MSDRVERTRATPWQEMEVEIGFKRLTPENWLEPDSVMRVFRYSAEEWVHDITAVRLSEDVPLEVRKLFAAARGPSATGISFTLCTPWLPSNWRGWQRQRCRGSMRPRVDPSA
jgi:hypothetical protein